MIMSAQDAHGPEEHERKVGMEKFTKVTGVAAPLMRQNVDTDLVIRIERLVNNTGRQGLGPYCFEQIRFKPDGSENPDCVLNQEPYRGAPIILSAENFGCGSSREGAVWALAGMGVKAVIAPSYGDIFYNNCFQNGLLPVALPLSEVEQLADEMRASPGNARVTVDLENCQVVSPTGRVIPFKIDARRQHALLNGLDDIAQTMTHKDKVEAWQATDKNARPWVWL
jgi:3-isopropylmalate/(R)-2-methylmalate dehydratase small subunit